MTSMAKSVFAPFVSTCSYLHLLSNLDCIFVSYPTKKCCYCLFAKNWLGGLVGLYLEMVDNSLTQFQWIVDNW